MHHSGLLGGLRLSWGQKLSGGEVDFKVMDGFDVVLVDEFTLVLMNVKGLGGGGGGGAGALKGPIESNRSFPVMSNLRIF